jgi:hypothetical protein
MEHLLLQLSKQLAEQLSLLMDIGITHLLLTEPLLLLNHLLLTTS